MIDLNGVLQKYRVFVDTSSWMFQMSESFFEGKMLDALKSSGKKLVVPGKVLEEVKKFLNHEDQEKRQKSRTAATILQKYINDGHAQVFGSEKDPFTDQTILYVFQQFRVRYHLALITQDRGLATDVYNLNNQRAVNGNPIRVFRISMQGELIEWRFEEAAVVQPITGQGAAGQAVVQHTIQQQPRSTQAGQQQSRQHSASSPPAASGGASEKEPAVKFRLGTKVASGGDEPMPCRQLPGEHDTVQSAKFGTIQLGETIGRGGEGDIYKTNLGLVCKIYKKERLTQGRYEKLKLMLTVPVDKKGICWPRDIVTNQHGEFVGFVMDAAEGKPMQTSLFAKPVLMKNFPHWTRLQLVDLCLTMLSLIEYLHQRNIIIGDINPMNILIKNEKEVYFVDTDSYQIENFPCPVGTVNFTAPEIQGKNYGTFLRTFEHENFAVATLIFMTLLPGKPPYSQQGGGTPEDNIRKMDFPYPFGDESTGKVPDGPWRFIWSHLTYKVKEALYKTFKENNRISVSDLKSLVKSYRYSIVQKWSSDELFPMSHKIPEGKAVMMVCSKCGQEKQAHIDHKQKLEERGRSFICEECFQRLRLERLQRMQAAAAARSSGAYSGSTVRPGSTATYRTQTQTRTGGMTGTTTYTQRPSTRTGSTYTQRPAATTGSSHTQRPTSTTGSAYTSQRPTGSKTQRPSATSNSHQQPVYIKPKAQPPKAQAPGKKSLLDRLIDFLSNI